jgi:hypothetical protein
MNEQKSARDRKQILFICIICILFVLIYGILLCMINSKRDILENELGLWDIDGWSMTHFIFFFFLRISLSRTSDICIYLIYFMGII